MSDAMDLSTVVKPRGACGMRMRLRNKRDPRKQMVVGAICDSWKCPKCGPKLRQKWIRHFTCRFRESRIPVYVSMVSKDSWSTFARRILRAGRQFATVEQTLGVLTVFTTFPTGAKVTGEGLIALLTKVIDTTEAVRRPVHTSRGWKLPEESVKISEWERIGQVLAEIGEAAKALEAQGLVVHRFWTTLRMGFVVDMPVGWNDARFNEALYYDGPKRIRFLEEVLV